MNEANYYSIPEDVVRNSNGRIISLNTHHINKDKKNQKDF